MSFFDSQIFGVIIGAAIGGIGKVLYDIRSKNQQCESLENGIKAEAKVVRDSVMAGHDNLSIILNKIESGQRSKQKFQSLPGIKMYYTEANLEKIGLLNKKFLVPLIEVKTLLEILPTGLNNLLKIHSKFIDGFEENQKLLVEELKTAATTYSYIGKGCEKLLNYSGNYSTTDQIIRYFRNTKDKFFKKR